MEPYEDVPAGTCTVFILFIHIKLADFYYLHTTRLGDLLNFIFLLITNATINKPWAISSLNEFGSIALENGTVLCPSLATT